MTQCLPGGSGLGPPELRWPTLTLTPTPGRCRKDWEPSGARQTPSVPTGPSASFPVPETRGLLGMQIKIRSSGKLAMYSPRPLGTVACLQFRWGNLELTRHLLKNRWDRG